MAWIMRLEREDLGDLQMELHGMGPRAKVAYLEIIMRMRRYGPIPVDDRLLAGIAGVGLKSWTDRIFPAVAHLFEWTEDNYLVHPGIEGAKASPAQPTARQVSARNAARVRHERERERRQQQLSMIAGDAAEAAETPAAHALRTAEEGSPHGENPAISMRPAEIFRAETPAAHDLRTAEAAAPAALRAHTHAPSDSSSSQSQEADSSGECESERGSGGEIAATAAHALRTAETPAQPPSPHTFAAPRARRPGVVPPATQTPIPAGWQPNEADRREATKRGYDPDEAAEAFRDIYRGNGATAADWSAKFRRVCREGIRSLAPRQDQRGLVMAVPGGGTGSGRRDPAATDAQVAFREAWLSGHPNLAQQRDILRASLRSQFNEVDYETWLRSMALLSIDGGVVTIGLPSPFVRDRVRTHYGDRLLALWREQDPEVERVEFAVYGLPEQARAPPAAAG
jgi:uncharacterized protein YdaU (DUF1376 family)